MLRGTRAAVAVIAAGSLAFAMAGNAIAKTPPTPLQVASGYMKPPVKISQKLPLTRKPPTGVKLGWLTTGTSQIIQQTEEAAKELPRLGWTMVIAQYVPSDGASINAGIQTVLSQGATAIVAPGLDNFTLISATTKAALAAANVPIIIGQSCPTQPIVPPIYPGAGMCANTAADATALANWIAADSGGKGHVLLSVISQFTILAAFRDQLAAQLKKACPACTLEVANVPYSAFLTNQIPSTMVSRLRADPSITYLMFDNAQFSRGILPALDAAGLLGKIKVGGRSVDTPSLEALKNNQEYVWTGYGMGTFAFGYLDAVARVLTKSPGLALNAVVPVRLITNANVGSVPSPYLWAPADSVAQYEKLWRLTK